MNKVKWLVGLLILLSLSACDRGQIFHKLRPNSVILAFGDSLTSGVGAEPGFSYPAQLKRMIAREVFNAGVPGETSAEALRRLPGVLDKQDPDLVIICSGGNDLLRNLGLQQLKENLRSMFKIINQRGIPVVMVAVPRPGLALHDAALYKEIADEFNIPLIEGVLGKLLSNPQFRSDPAHPNSAGYRKLAEAIADKLFALGVI
ncbi:MAG: arylesterase [Deltaproteobacteria bacterium]|nr:arylesterase [Deltaproteobacteria bacterium]